jgi:hypothetical protein
MDLTQCGQARSFKTDSAQEPAPVFVDPFGRFPGNVTQVEAVSHEGGSAAAACGEAVTQPRQILESVAAVISYSPDFPKDKAFPPHTGNIDLSGRFLSTCFRSSG